MKCGGSILSPTNNNYTRRRVMVNDKGLRGFDLDIILKDISDYLNCFISCISKAIGHETILYSFDKVTFHTVHSNPKISFSQKIGFEYKCLELRCIRNKS